MQGKEKRQVERTECFYDAEDGAYYEARLRGEVAVEFRRLGKNETPESSKKANG